MIEGLSREELLAGARQIAALGAEHAPAAAVAGPELEGPLAEALFWGAFARSAGDAAAALQARRRLPATLAGGAGAEADAGRPFLGFAGLGGAIWGFATLGSLLEDPVVREHASALAQRITPALIAADEALDVMGGSAGALLALLALASHEPGREPRSRLLETARLCAARLLATQRREGGWPARRKDRSESGFAHGAAGISYALLALHRMAPDPRLPAAAALARRWEETLFRAEKERYLPFPDFDPTNHLMSAWCWGSPGIALARAALHAAEGDEAAIFQAERNLRISLAQKQNLEDHLCCGNLGRALIFGRLARFANLSPALLAEGHRATAALVRAALARARRRGCFGCGPPEQDPQWALGFLKGTSGIGYALLHLASPELVPFPLVLAGLDGISR